MHAMHLALWSVSIWLLLATPGLAEEQQIVAHFDPITVDPQLTLPGVIDLTLEKYPEGALLPALQQEAEALQRRGDSWLAGALNAVFFYRNSWAKDAVNTGAPEFEGAIEVPLWNWGQRAAGQQVAENAAKASKLQAKVLKLQVAGLVRKALWDLRLESKRHELARRVYEIEKKLTATVRRRVESGDLPRTDLLLAESELLVAQTALVHAEAEEMHARKHYSILTQMQRLPADFEEQQSAISIIDDQHPLLNAMNAAIARKKAELQWVKAAGSGQTTVAVGVNSQIGSNPEVAAETVTLEINMPFGGGAHLAPEIADANLQLTEVFAQRNRLYRRLLTDLHEAEHALEIDHAELAIALQRQKIAREYLKIGRISFAAGETDLLDFLKMQSRSFAAIEEAAERRIILQRDIALYNQAAGVLP